MPKKCLEIKELLSPYLDGELTPQEVKLVEDHLARCPSCQAEFAALKELDEAIFSLDVEKPSHEFFPRLIHNLSKEYGKKKEKRNFLIQLAPLAAAASILLIVLAASQFFLIEYPKETLRRKTTIAEKGVETIVEDRDRLVDEKARESVSGLSTAERAKMPAAKSEARTEESGGRVLAGKAADIEEITPHKKAAKAGPYNEVAKNSKSLSNKGYFKKETKIEKPLETDITFAQEKPRVEVQGELIEQTAAPEAVDGAKQEYQLPTVSAPSAQRRFDKETTPRQTAVHNEFEIDVAGDDEIGRNISPNQNVGIIVDLDSSGNVLAANLIETSGSDTIDSMVIQNVRNQNFRVLTRGQQEFPSRQAIYYRFRQTDQ